MAEASEIPGITKVQISIQLKNKGRGQIPGVYLITEAELEELKDRKKEGRPKKP